MVLGTPTFRSTTAADLGTVTGITLDEGVGSIAADGYLDEAAQGRYRPAWTWIAELDGRPVGRALWWGQASDEHPVALDCLQVDADVPDRAAVASGLLAAGLRAFAEAGAPRPPLYNLTVATAWRDDPEVAAAVAWRRTAALAAGLTEEVERLRLEWTPADGVPSGGDRLVYDMAGDEEFLAVLRRVAVGSLDDQTRRNLAARGPDATARDELDFYLGCPGDRAWWRLARTPDGRLAGLVIPSATPYHRNIGYLAVLPEMRGQGLVDDLLAWATRLHATAGAKVVTATTDTTNAPMATAFARAGFRTAQRRLIWSAPPT